MSIDRPLTDQEQRATDMLARYLDRWSAPARASEGTARQTTWQAEDGWLITYTTSRIEGGEHDGKFMTQAAKPGGKRARSDPKNAEYYQVVYERTFSTRKAAKAQAEKLYRKHSPKWATSNPEA